MPLPKLSNALLLSVVVAASGLAAKEIVAEEALALEGTNWQLVQVTVLGGFVFSPEDHGKYVLNFRSGNRLTGTSDCNRLSGSWHQEGLALHFDPFATTTNLCVAGSLHNNLVLYLKDVDALSLRDGHLVMTTPTEGVEIEFESRD